MYRLLLASLLQALAICCLILALQRGNIGLAVALPLAVLVAWLPLLLKGGAPAPVVETGDDESLLRLSRDLSRTTSGNALSAAEVAYSVKQLAQRLASQLQAAVSIVGNAEVRIATEEQTSLLSQRTLEAAHDARRSSDEGLLVLRQSIARMHQLSGRASASRRPGA